MFKDFLLDSGLLSYLRQRPFSKVPDPECKPRAIFVSMIETAPFSLDLEFALSDYKQDIINGINMLKSLTDGSVYLSMKKGSTFFEESDLGDIIIISNVHKFEHKFYMKNQQFSKNKI